MALIKKNGTEIFYSVVGQGSPLIMLPGLTGDQTMWGNIVLELQKHYQVILIDNRGAGRSQVTQAPFSISDMANDVMNVIEELKLKKTSILGHSMGGYVAQEFAIQYPEKLDKLILMSTRCKASPLSTIQSEIAFHLIDSKIDPIVLIKNSMTWCFGETFMSNEKNVTDYIERSLNRQYPAHLEGFKHQVLAINSFENNNLEKIQAPTLIINGEEDRIAPIPYSDYMKKHIPNAQQVILKNVGHMPHIEDCDQVVQQINKFLKLI
ncbi:MULTISPECIES: alpha/beta fold hydrolase [unclassified Francisella]|uniref:alpha/beta fold hydrolase n=1 Tax=unclassified Francisella TaxID=2610885 RepID=UPI002E336A45|nr:MULTISPECIES: alpha/beta hydrolase [unclassified Francisella]MED7819464.1 alpha/beta hydrolase [Francisella sp. 19S2-4]MED7830253.1 alpha/beta hydrolase [Francisella sp. 19S2-10]